MSFAELVDLAAREGVDWTTLGRCSGAGRLCKHCRPWLQQALAGGPLLYQVDSDLLRNGDVLYHHFCPPEDTGGTTPPAV